LLFAFCFLLFAFCFLLFAFCFALTHPSHAWTRDGRSRSTAQRFSLWMSRHSRPTVRFVVVLLFCSFALLLVCSFARLLVCSFARLLVCSRSIIGWRVSWTASPCSYSCSSRLFRTFGSPSGGRQRLRCMDPAATGGWRSFSCPI
jgi:hypothetical protein